MRFLLSIALMVVFSFAASYFLPWWSIAIVCFVVAFGLKLRGGRAFLSGFLSIFILWLVITLVKDQANEHILSTRMAGLFKLNNPVLFMTVAAIIGGLTGGLSALSGALAGRAIRKA